MHILLALGNHWFSSGFVRIMEQNVPECNDLRPRDLRIPALTSPEICAAACPMIASFCTKLQIDYAIGPHLAAGG
jgi:hypothetical protein